MVKLAGAGKRPSCGEGDAEPGVVNICPSIWPGSRSKLQGVPQARQLETALSRLDSKETKTYRDSDHPRPILILGCDVWEPFVAARGSEDPEQQEKACKKRCDIFNILCVCIYIYIICNTYTSTSTYIYIDNCVDECVPFFRCKLLHAHFQVWNSQEF